MTMMIVCPWVFPLFPLFPLFFDSAGLQMSGLHSVGVFTLPALTCHGLHYLHCFLIAQEGYLSVKTIFVKVRRYKLRV